MQLQCSVVRTLVPRIAAGTYVEFGYGYYSALIIRRLTGLTIRELLLEPPLDVRFVSVPSLQHML